MGNIETHDFAPVHDYERKELNLSKRITYRQYCKHINGEAHEAMLTELPWNIRDSVSLYEHMNVSFNVLTEIPPELPLRLPHLSYVDLSHNRITDLPESFGLLFHLTTLLINHNNLKQLPSSFVHLVKLTKVDLSHNLLRELPDDMGKMESLAKLNVSNNKLRALPLSLGDCPTLLLLLATGNKLETPPQAICNEGSEPSVQFLKKLYSSSVCDAIPQRPPTPLNAFLRVRGNQSQNSVSNPQSAHQQYIQEQTCTTNTPIRIKTPLLPPLEASQLDPFELRDRIIGMVYGAAIGDAIGVATRWMSKDECNFHYEDNNISYSEIVQDEHRVRWRKGDWTGNFDLFMLLFDSIISWGGVVDELDFAKRLMEWSKKGFPELGDSEGVVLSKTIQKILEDERFITDPHGAAESIVHDDRPIENGFLPSSTESMGEGAVIAGATSTLERKSCLRTCATVVQDLDVFGTDNGAVVRTAILGVPFFHNLGEVEGNALRICKATHADTRCIASCVMVSLLVSFLLQGRWPLSDCENLIQTASECSLVYLKQDKYREEFEAHIKITDIAGLKSNQRGQMSHTYKPMVSGLLALRSQEKFKTFMMKLILEAGDSNSNACVAGALLGCKIGFSHLPADWIEGLRKKQTTWLNSKINLLLDMMGLP